MVRILCMFAIAVVAEQPEIHLTPQMVLEEHRVAEHDLAGPCHAGHQPARASCPAAEPSAWSSRGQQLQPHADHHCPGSAPSAGRTPGAAEEACQAAAPLHLAGCTRQPHAGEVLQLVAGCTCLVATWSTEVCALSGSRGTTVTYALYLAL